jgi:hypothetical protein
MKADVGPDRAFEQPTLFVEERRNAFKSRRG